eukprot:1237225-Prymnesium_polylepis.1
MRRAAGADSDEAQGSELLPVSELAAQLDAAARKKRPKADVTAGGEGDALSVLTGTRARLSLIHI